MYVANTHLKPVIGIDIHFVNAPFPFIPLPHPYIGLVIDPFDYLPWIGATVKVNNVPRGNTDTAGILITFIHIPFGAGFTLMPLVGHDSSNFFGSKTVQVDGAPMSGAGYILMTCNDIGIPLSFSPGRKFIPIPSLYLPTAFCIPLTWGKPVKVGGPLVPHFSLMSLLKAFAFGSALKIFGKLGGKLLKVINKKILKKCKSTQKLSNKLCDMGFEPVDLVTGRVNYEYTDFTLPGAIPIAWTRSWDSDSSIQGLLGHGVQLCYERSVQFFPEENCLAVTLEDGRLAVFPLMNFGESYYHSQEKLQLHRKQNGNFLLEDYENDAYLHFNHHVEEHTWQLSFIENYSGNRVQMHYSGKYLRAITDSAGRQLLLTLDKMHRITKVEVKHRDVQQVLVTYTYNEEGDMTGIGDALGQYTTMEYQDHLMIKKTDRNGYSFFWEYDDEHRCVHTWGEDGLLEGFIEYHKGYNIVTNSLGETTTYFYTEDNLIVQKTDHYGNHTYTDYTEDFEIYRQIDEAGNITGYTYDDRGRMTLMTLADGSQGRFVFNQDNNLTLHMKTDSTTDTFGYDEQRRLSYINSTNGKVTNYEYNQDGQLICITESAENARKTQITYDEDNNIASIQTADGATWHWKYDALGRAIQSINADGETRFIDYDALNRIRNVYLPDGNHIKLSYNAYDQITHLTDKFGQARFEYTPLGKLKMQHSASQQLEYLYDTEERLCSIINETGQRYLFEYDKRGQVIGETGFDGIAQRYELDEVGRIIRTIRPGGKFTNFEYDARNRVVRMEQQDGSWELYSYDKRNQLIEATNEYATVRFNRNKQGWVEEEIQNGYVVNRKFDKNGHCTHIQSSLGADIQMQRDIMGKTTQMNAAVTFASLPGITKWQAQIFYNRMGHETERLLPGKLSRVWKHDHAGRPMEEKISVNNTTQSWKKYTWNAEERLSGIFDALTAASTVFKYDSLSNLVFAQYADSSVVHRAADDAGHIYETPARNDRRYDGAGAIQESKQFTFKYDEEGQLVSKTQKGTHQKTQYEWYANGRLKRVIRPDGKTVDFTYDALGRRISKRYAGRITRWVWDGMVPLHEWTYDETEKPQAMVNEWGDITYNREEPNPNTQVQTAITWIFDYASYVPAAKIVNGKAYSILSDHMGTPHSMYDEKGEKVFEGVLDIYGRLRTIVGHRSDLPFRYLGQYEDVETGLYYNRFRYYSPEEGVYISQDPVGLAGGLRPYGYVNDPNSWADPLGLDKMNGASAKVGIEGQPNHKTYYSSGVKGGPHAEFSGLNDLQANGGFKNQRVVISEVLGDYNPGGWLPAPVCVPCRAGLFTLLHQGQALSVEMPINSGKKRIADIRIPRENFLKVQAELNHILATYTHTTTRSNKAWDALLKHADRIRICP